MSNTVSFHNVKIENLYISGGMASGAFGMSAGKRFSITPNRPQSGFDYPVRPRVNNTGTICASISMDGVLNDVRAIVYESSVYSEPSSPNANPGGVSGIAPVGSTNYTWEWPTAKEIPGAAHAASNYPQNTLLIWSQINSGDQYFLAGTSLFYGMTGSDAPCGGSGSGGPHSGSKQACGATLDITVPDGALRGIYKCTPFGPTAWEVAIDGAKLLLTLSGCGKQLILHRPDGSSDSSDLSELPFHASFDGASFRADQRVLVTLA